MRILMVNKFLYARGGAETVFLKLGAELARRGHEVQYFGMADENNTVFNRAGQYVSPTDFHASGLARFTYPFRIVYSFEARRKIMRVIDDFHPDVVHLHNYNYQLTPSVIDGACARGVPVVQTVHDTQMLCPSHMMLNLNDFTLCEKCVNHSKLNCVRQKCIHNSLAKSLIGAAEGELYARRSNYRRVRLFICPSRFMQGMLAKDARFKGRCRVLQNFIELKPLEAPPAKKDYVLYFGRLSVEKGIDRLLAACRLLPEVPFVICGSGPEEGLMKKLPPNVRFDGFQTGEALAQRIAEAALSVYFPILYENCPMSVLESQSLGTPVVANRIGGIPELIEDGVNGVLLDRFTPEAYAEAISALYRDPERLAAMRAACLAKRGEMVSLERYAQETEQIYAQLLERP